MELKKTFNNFLYQSLFQLMKILLPMITIPIVSNALGPEGIGVYNYTNSIAQYFVLIAGLGVGVYGNREISIVSDNKDKLSRKFWELFSMSFVVSMVSLLLYLIFVSFSDNRFFFYLQSLIIVAAVFDISWFFMGIEDFKKSSLSSLAAQLFSFFGIVLFVKEPSDLWIYILLQSLNVLTSQGIMWVFIRHKVNFVRVRFSDMLKHFFPAFQYFIPKIAIVLYTNLNKTLLGWMDSPSAVGYYSNTLTVNGILVTLITTLDLVLLPRLSNLASKGGSKEIVKTMKKTVNIQLFFTIPMMFGLILITPKFVPWFFGDKFLLLTKTIPMVAPLVIVIPLGMAVGRQFLIPMNRIGVYNLAVIVGALVSIVTNLILIPRVGLYGAIIATLLAELFVTITRFSAFVKETKFRLSFMELLTYVVSGGIMYVSVYYATSNLSAGIKTTLIQGVSGVAVYFILTTLLKSNPLIPFLKKLKS